MGDKAYYTYYTSMYTYYIALCNNHANFLRGMYMIAINFDNLIEKIPGPEEIYKKGADAVAAVVDKIFNFDEEK